MDIRFLYSSSSGNSTIIHDDQTTIIIDAGTSYKKLVEANDGEIKIDAIFITHEHSDHIAGLGVLGRKTKAVIFIPERSYGKIKHTLKGCKINFIKGGDTYKVGSLNISAFSTRHDSLESVGYTVQNEKSKYGHVTDTGVMTAMVTDAIKDCNALFIETDYDYYALDDYEDYDDALKARIQSGTGHLSNQQVVKYLIKEANFDGLKWVMLGHLSPRTNSPDILNKLLNKYVPAEKLSKISIFTEPKTLTL